MAEPSDRDLQRLFDLDEPAGPARSLDARRSAAIVAAALRGAGFPPASGGGSGGPSGASAGGAVKTAISTKLVLVVGGAAAIAAVAWLAVRAPDEAVPRPPAAASASASIAPSQPPAAPTAPTTAAAMAPPPATAAPTAPAATAPATSPPESAAPGAQGASTQAIAPAETASAPAAVPAHTPSRTRPRHHRPKASAAPATTAEAEDLLAEANAARTAHDWRGADALYRRVARGGTTGGLAAQTALVASAEIHLQHLGDPAGAARGFRAALASGAKAALAEDARWGLAECARALDDAAAERRALDDFLAHHPGSPRTERARARRAELETIR